MVKTQTAAIAPAQLKSTPRSEEAANQVSSFERLAADVSAGRASQAQVEAFVQGLPPLSDEASNVFWAWSGGGTPGAAGEGAALRERMTAALKTLADAMPGAVVYKYGPEFADAIKSGELMPTVTMRGNSLQVAMETARLKGDLGAAKGFAQQLVSEFPKTAAGRSAAALLAQDVKGSVAQRATTGWEGTLRAAPASTQAALVSVPSKRPPDVSAQLDALAGLASDVKMGYATKDQVEQRLSGLSMSPAGSDWLWSAEGQGTRAQLLASMQAIAQRFPDAVVTRYPPETLRQWEQEGQHFDPTLDARVSVLQFQMNDAQARGDSAALQQFARQLLDAAPNSALVPWAKNVLAS